LPSLIKNYQSSKPATKQVPLNAERDMTEYQRAVTPVGGGADAVGGGGGVSLGGAGLDRGKILTGSYQTSQLRRGTTNKAGVGSVGGVGGAFGTSSVSESSINGGGASGSNRAGFSSQGSLSAAAKVHQQALQQQLLLQQQQQLQQQQLQQQQQAQLQLGIANLQQQQQQQQRGGVEMNIQGRSAGSRGVGGGGLPLVPGILRMGAEAHFGDHGSSPSLASLPRYDLIPLSEEVPADGVVFARIRNHADSLVVFRTPEERLRNPERLNLDRRQLDVCPLLEQEQRLRLLNFQNNNIRVIQNLENLPNLIFLDLYNNKLVSLEGPVSSVKGLRVLMAGKNRISAISNLTQLRKLDVLDLHSNEIRAIDGLEGLSDLRVLNLAGNRISMVQNLSSLQALTELNLRRNNIERVLELDKLPALQRVFLSHNLIGSIPDMQCLFNVKFLIELSLDGNPMSDSDPVRYRNRVVAQMTGLRHLDLKRITDEERAAAVLINASIKESEAEASASTSELKAFNRANGTAEVEGPGLPAANGSDSSWGEPLSFNPSCPPPSGSVGLPKFEGTHEQPSTMPRLDSDTAGVVQQQQQQQSLDSRGIAALARAGRVSSSHSLFDLELISANEKALVAVGDAWEWIQTRRLLVNVTEASLYHMKRDVIVSKFASNLSWLPALKCLRLVNNEFESLKDIDVLIESLGTSFQLEHLTIRDNPICSSQSLLRAYVAASIPSLKSFNDVEISPAERSDSIRTLRPVMKIHDLAVSQQFSSQLIQQQNQVSTAARAGVILRSKVGGAGGGGGGGSAQFKRSGMASSGQRSVASVSTQIDEQAIADLCAETTQTALGRRNILHEFDVEFKYAVQQIFEQAVADIMSTTI